MEMVPARLCCGRVLLQQQLLWRGKQHKLGLIAFRFGEGNVSPRDCRDQHHRVRVEQPSMPACEAFSYRPVIGHVHAMNC
jgi:hypothetical protein